MVNLRQTKLVLGVLAVILAVVAQRVWSQETAVRSLNASDSSEDSSLAPVVAADNLREGFGQVPSDASRADLFGSRPIVQLAQAVQPAVQPTPLPPATTSTATPSTPSTDIGLGSVGSSFLLDLQSVLQPSPGSPLIPTNKNDATTLLENVPGITLERRVQSVHDGILRGRRLGQVLAKGSDWFPARQDLDTPLSKIDSRIVERFTVTKGPYNVLHGPGLAFFDVKLLRAPRYEDGYQSFGSSVLEYQTNGEQWNGRQSFEGGSWDWGYRVGYSHRTGSDYEAGDGSKFIDSYNSRLPDFALGADLTENSSIDFHYLRLDQTNVEFPGQVFDIDFLVTDAYEIRYAVEPQRFFDQLRLEVWYNRTRFEGNANSPGKRQQIPVLNDFLASGFTDADAMSAGGSTAISWGDVQEYLTIGADYRYLKQRLNEIDTLLPSLLTFNYPIPRSHTSHPGAFIERQLTPNESLTVRTGARVDWVSANADESVPGTERFDLERQLRGEFDQHFVPWAAFVTIQQQLSTGLAANAGAGHAMRPPTRTELYSIEPFLAVMPQFLFNSPFGNPNLDPERLWQIDLGLHYESDCVRGGINGFYAWVQDYITFDASPNFVLTNPDDTPFNYTWVNTELATLAGGEGYCELDWTNGVTTFASFSYVEGRDHTRLASNSPIRADSLPGSTRSEATFRTATEEEPLPVMPPLEGRVGLRCYDPCQSNRWQIEFSARIVDSQDRVATSLFEQTTPGFTTFDVRGYRRISDAWLLTAGVENLTDRNYQEHFDPHRQLGAQVLQPGQNFFFGTELNY